MNTLSYAAKTAARTGYDYFNVLASASGAAPPLPALAPHALAPHAHANGFIPINYNAHVRAASAVGEDAEEPADDGSKKKRKRGPAKKDPHAPKKPIAAYFQFTAAARPIIKQDMGKGISAREVASEAAIRWAALPAEEKQMWLAQHHQQMVQWYIDINAYRAGKGLPLEPVPKDYQPGARPTHLVPAAVEEGREEEEEEDEEAATTPDEAGEDGDEGDEESPATPPPPAKKAKATPRQNGAPGSTNSPAAAAPKKRGRPPKDRSGAPAPVPAPAPVLAPPTAAAAAAQADTPATPDTPKRTRAPSIKAKEAKELALARAPARSPSKTIATSTATPTTTTTTTTAADAGAEKQAHGEEPEGSITVLGGAAGLKMKSVETVGSMKEKRERKKRRGNKAEE
ncbi:hypothetical protein EV426DRAFT_703155 [Tirmania nivea]|nr:hypothetical protein EV426DRAFT_703155 [Tirmania nivea]